MGEKKEIIIDLSTSSNAKKYIENQIIQQRELDRAKKLINERLNRKDNEIRYNDTISIIGSRGSGKTSFMLSLLDIYSKDKDIQVLKVIDPTLIEEKGHIFLVIISLIQSLVQDQLNSSECDPHSDTFLKKEEWKKMLRKLAAGFPTLDGIGGQTLNESNWQDAEYVLDKGLKAVSSAFDLETNFNRIIEHALIILKKKSFMIALDDIDVDFRKGWPVLETIRKYMTSHQLIVLVSGDLQLFSKAVRKQQWKNFGKALLMNETESFYDDDQEAKDKKRALGELITEMESQYLQKVLKPENRIHLTTLYDIIQLYKETITIKLDNKEREDIELLEYYKEILKILGIQNPIQAEAYYSYLMTLPIRTQIQFMRNFEKLELNDEVNLSDAFLSDLYEEEVDIQLATNLPKMLNVVILKLLLKERNLDEAYQLQPTTSKQSINSSLLALSFLFSKQVRKNPFLIFDFMIKIGYIRNLLTVLDYHEITDSTYSKPTIEGLCRHSGILQDKVLRDVLGNINAYVESNSVNKDRKNNDVIYLYATSAKNKGSIEESKGRIDYVFSIERDNITAQDQTLAFIPISTSSYLHYNSSKTVYSLYTLIGTIGELLKQIQYRDLDSGLSELSQWRTYPMIYFEKGIASLSDIEENKAVKMLSEENGNSNLISWFKKWYENYPKDISFSPHLIGKITTRIYYTINSISNHSECNTNLGIAMHRRIVALMNAVLIEDIRENCKTGKGLNISNAVTADDIFENNLDFAIKLHNDKTIKYESKFSKWIISCPLFLLYIDPMLLNNSKLIDYLETFFIDREEIIQQNIFEKLSNVELPDITPQKRKKKESSIIKSGKPKFRSKSDIERQKVLKMLIDNEISYQLFIDGKDKTEIQQLNININEACKGLFEEEVLESTPIRNFRRFIFENEDKNDLIIKWKKAQL